MNASAVNREAIPEQANPLMLEGLAFIEYATTRPQALGQVLETMGFRPVARHRSREVTLYRQGTMNLVVNAHPDDARVSATQDGQPVISAVAFQCRDAARAHQRCLSLGAWDMPSHAGAMELHIPSIQGPGGSRLYLVDRWREFSIFDIDFVPIPGVDAQPPALSGMGFFGVVQYVGLDRSAEWLSFYEALFGFVPIPDEQRFGIMPKGHLLRSPCEQFLWQLIEPEMLSFDLEPMPERLQRIGLGVPNVLQAVQQLRARGVAFVDTPQLQPDDRGALTQTQLGSVAFELVHQAR